MFNTGVRRIISSFSTRKFKTISSLISNPIGTKSSLWDQIESRILAKGPLKMEDS